VRLALRLFRFGTFPRLTQFAAAIFLPTAVFPASARPSLVGGCRRSAPARLRRVAQSAERSNSPCPATARKSDGGSPRPFFLFSVIQSFMTGFFYIASA